MTSTLAVCNRLSLHV